MVALKWLVVRFEHKEKRGSGLPAGLAAAAAVDTFVDGVIISASFSADQQVGALLAIALSLELLFLTLSVGVEFREINFGTWPSLAITSGIALLQLVGAVGAGSSWQMPLERRWQWSCPSALQP